MPTSEQLQKLQGLQQQMVPIEAIAEEIGVSQSTIYRWLRTLPKFERRAPRNIIDQLSFHQDYINLRMDEGETQPKTILKEIKERGYVGSKRTLTNYIVRRRRANRAQQLSTPAVGTPPVGATPDPDREAEVPQPDREAEVPQPDRVINARLATLIEIATPRDTVEPTLLSALCQDDTGLLSQNGADRTVRVKMTQAGIVYAERDQEITPQAQVLIMAELDTDQFGRAHAAELITHQGPTSITALMRDIDSLTDLLEADQLKPPAPLPEPDAATAPEPAPAPETAPDMNREEDTNQEEETDHEPETVTNAPSRTGRYRRSRTLPSRDTTRHRDAANGTEDMTETLSPQEPPQEPPLQDHTSVIADAWNELPEESHLSSKVIQDTVLRVAQEIARAAGHPLDTDNADSLTTTDIGKGFTITPAWLDGGVAISRTTTQGTRTGYLATICNPQEGLGVRDPEFPSHIQWWHPDFQPKPIWLENTLRLNAARFIRECQ